MRTIRLVKPPFRVLSVTVITAMCLGMLPATATAAVISEETIMHGEMRWHTGGVSRSIVAAPLPESGIAVWDRSTDTSVVIPANPVSFAGCVVGGDLVAWIEADGDTGAPPSLYCYNARTRESTKVAATGVEDVVTDGRFVAYTLDPNGGSRCWDSLTGTTRTVPATGDFGLVQADMQDGLLVWVDDLHSINEGSDPDTGFIRAWDAVTGQLTRITTNRAAVRMPKTDGHQVAWTHSGTTRLWDPSSGARTVPGMNGDLVLDHGVLVALGATSYSVREPSGVVRTISGNNPHPDHADFSDGMLSGVFTNPAVQPQLRAVDIHTGAADSLAGTASDDTFVRSAADLVVSTDSGDSGPIELAQIARPVRLEGRTRFDVAVSTAEASYPRWEGVRDVIIACGDDRASADPLAAAGLCWRYDAPLMLVSSSQAPASVRAAVKEIVHNNGPVTIHVVGGTVSVPDAVVSQITAAAGSTAVTVDRVAAPNRYALAAAIARRVALGHEGELPAALIANGGDATKFFDAAALSAIAAAKGYPVLLVERERIPATTASFISSADPAELVAAGGRATISDAVLRDLGAERWAGADRYATAAAIATNASDPGRGWLSPNTCGFAALLPDALSGGALAGHKGGPLLLTARTALPAATAGWLSTHNGDIDTAWVLGGSDSVWSSALSQAGAHAFD